MSQLIQTVKDKASEGALDSILSFFHIFFNAHPSLNFFLNEWLLIEGNYNNVVKDFGQGIVSSEFYHAKIAQSRKAVLQVLDDLDEQLETDLSFNDAVAKADFFDIL